MVSALYDVAISEEFSIASKSCASTLRLSGLSAIILPVDKINASFYPACALTAENQAGDDTFVFVIQQDTEEAGKATAYEILAELFDDCEP